MSSTIACTLNVPVSVCLSLFDVCALLCVSVLYACAVGVFVFLHTHSFTWHFCRTSHMVSVLLTD